MDKRWTGRKMEYGANLVCQNFGIKFISQKYNKQRNINKISFHKYHKMFFSYPFIVQKTHTQTKLMGYQNLGINLWEAKISLNFIFRGGCRRSLLNLINGGRQNTRGGRSFKYFETVNIGNE